MRFEDLPRLTQWVELFGRVHERSAAVLCCAVVLGVFVIACLRRARMRRAEVVKRGVRIVQGPRAECRRVFGP